MASDSLIDQNDSAKATDATDSKKLISDEVEVEIEINSANTCNGDESHENCLSVIEKSAVTALHSTSSSNLSDEIMVVDRTNDGTKNSKPNTLMTTLNHTRTAVSTPDTTKQPEKQTGQQQPLIYKYNQSKWNIAFYCILLRCICDGIEYSIIIPSLKNYLDTAFTWEDPENPPTIKWNSYVLASSIRKYFFSSGIRISTRQTLHWKKSNAILLRLFNNRKSDIFSGSYSSIIVLGPIHLWANSLRTPFSRNR